MVQSLKKTLWIGMTVILLAACGGEKNEAPGLSAPPTRTPAPTGQVEQAAAASRTGLDIISMGETVNQFLVRSAEISPLDQGITFIQTVGETAPDCLDDQRFDLFFELASLHLPLMDMTAWQASAEIFPQAELEQGIIAAAADVPELMPADGSTLRVCLVPLPYIDPPADTVPAQGRRLLPHMAAMSDLHAVALDGSTLLVMCSAGEDCLDDLPLHLERALSVAYQLRQSGTTLQDIPLLTRLIYEGRADDFALRRDPAITFPWNDALTPEGENAYWRQFRHVLMDDGFPSYDSVANMVYGVSANAGQFPVWGGLYVGDQIVRAYLEQFPQTSWHDLAALDPVLLLEESGYGPANAQTRLVE